MLLESLKERWKAIEEIGSDAEKRGEVLGVVPSWQPAIEGETFDFPPTPTPLPSRTEIRKLRDMKRAHLRTNLGRGRKKRAAG
ncbi:MULTISPECIES: hypothetical protein [unclassified Rhizobium]|uniref:hypothetical protein n=1 Tax=unclassified Rhizobium TaxID=2613769 RepID=UPI001AD9D7F2|nr:MULTISPECIES: hypothetical protein [unclassified Rhizobium]MBO9102108.1 hypothetical protein [Rhizobium sp. L58/93]QXZ87137.1 hypothetical protein J5287_21385 [Rhizobium sp. K1/93]QXZ92829.1 hypothetical protein J5280_19510 [Rhizobium sp. K15/93]QYA03948.1 hypothetical protein J5278_24545 [Rhizobium sp. B21/90]